MERSLSIDDLEAVWECLAQAIDRAGPQNERLFLGKLALLLADAVADQPRIVGLIEAALENLT